MNTIPDKNQQCKDRTPPRGNRYKRWKDIGRPHILLLSTLVCVVILAYTSFSPLPSHTLTGHTAANGVAQKPPMGWASWNAHFENINASAIKGHR